MSIYMLNIPSEWSGGTSPLTNCQQLPFIRRKSISCPAFYGSQSSPPALPPTTSFHTALVNSQRCYVLSPLPAFMTQMLNKNRIQQKTETNSNPSLDGTDIIV